MKQKFIKVTKALLSGCMAFAWWAAFDVPSSILLGEYAFPTNEEE